MTRKDDGLPCVYCGNPGARWRPLPYDWAGFYCEEDYRLAIGVMLEGKR